MRGRLINKLIAGFSNQNVATTVLDDVYTEPVTDRVDGAVFELPCQVEDPSWFRATFKPGGLEATGEVSLILAYPDLEDGGYINAQGSSLINIGTKLHYIKTLDGVIINKHPDPDGMFVILARDSSFGLSVDGIPTRNLLFLLLAPREKGSS